MKYDSFFLPPPLLLLLPLQLLRAVFASLLTLRPPATLLAFGPPSTAPAFFSRRSSAAAVSGCTRGAACRHRRVSPSSPHLIGVAVTAGGTRLPLLQSVELTRIRAA